MPTETIVAPKSQTVGRVDLDSDIDLDGVITNDGTDSGELEAVPPGQIIGPALMTKFVLRATPFAKVQGGSVAQIEIDPEKLLLSLEVRSMNIGRKDGAFATEEDERKLAGHLRVWSDEKGSKLLLDSRDPNKRRMEWNINSPEAPGFVYVECVEPSAANAVFVLTLQLDDTSSKQYNPKNGHPNAARDFVVVSCKTESPEIEPDDTEPKKKPSKNGKHSFGYGNYASFASNDRDSKNVWVKPPAHRNP